MASPSGNILFPQIHFYANDSWALVRGVASSKAVPILLMNRHSRGIIYLLDIPENIGELYELPQPVLAVIPLPVGPAVADQASRRARSPLSLGAASIHNDAPRRSAPGRFAPGRSTPPRRSEHPMQAPWTRYDSFCRRFGLRLPILLAPMAGACPPALSSAVTEAGGLGGCGALLMQPAEMRSWAEAVRRHPPAPFQMNLWVPDPPPVRDAAREARVREFLSRWGPAIAAETGDGSPPDFAAQCEALLAIAPAAASSIMGLYPPPVVAALKQRGIAWFATVTTVREARQAEAAGADVIVAQGMEAGGHRGCFDAALAEQQQVGLLALLPQVVDAVRVPVVATGGIADARGIAAALVLGASAVQIGTGFLRCPEAALAPAWARALADARPEETVLTRAFSGRAGRGIANDYVRAAASADAPPPAPYPVQRALTAAMRKEAASAGDLRRMQTWAGQGAALASTLPAAQLVQRLWRETRALLGGALEPSVGEVDEPENAAHEPSGDAATR